MKIKYLIPLLCMLSITFADNEKRINGKKWHKKHHNIYKHQSHNVVKHPRNHVNIRYGFHWCLTPWRNFYPRHNHTNLVVIKDEVDNNEDNMETFSKNEMDDVEHHYGGFNDAMVKSFSFYGKGILSFRYNQSSPAVAGFFVLGHLFLHSTY